MNRPTAPSGKKAPNFAQASLLPLQKAEDCCHQAEPVAEPSAAARPAGNARYSWKVQGMDCPACARKVEVAVQQVAGVTQTQVVFATEKLVVDASEDIRRAVEDAVHKAGYALSVDGAAPQPHTAWREYFPLALITALMGLSWGIALFSPVGGKAAFTITTLAGLWPVARQALRQIRAGSPFAIETLMCVAAVCALFIGATAEAAMVLLLFQLGERLEAFAAARARRGVTALMALRPETAIRLRDGAMETVPVAALRPGDCIEVAAGARLPADGRLLNDSASFDESALTGESLPVEKSRGDGIAAGATSLDSKALLEVTSQPGDSAIDRILRLIEEADARRAPIERFIDRFSRSYTPAIMALALLTATVPPLLFGAAWSVWIYKALALLLIGCPCALVISTPAAITSALASAAQRGILIKGGAALESLGRIRQIAFDKTGTLTTGQPQVTAIRTFSTYSEAQVLTLSAAIERGSTHPLAQAIVRTAEERQLVLPNAEQQRTLAGIGIEATVNGERLRLISPARVPVTLLRAEEQALVQSLEAEGHTLVILLTGETALGAVALRDTLRSEAPAALAELGELGIQCIMLTGDNPRAAAAIADTLHTQFQAGLLPADKVDAVRKLSAASPLAMVGDGINDAPAMKAATIGIAMGGGTDVALEAADAALSHNRLNELPALIRLARATHNNVRQNIAIALGLKAVFLVTTLIGFTGLWLAVLADSGATALVTANALRLLRRKKQG